MLLYLSIYLIIHILSQQGHSHILGPLLSSLACEQRLTTLVQEMFLLAQNSDNHQLQQYAAWGISFLRYYLWSKELPGLDSSQADVARTKSVPQSVPDDSVVMKLGQWLKYLNFSRVGLLQQQTNLYL